MMTIPLQSLVVYTVVALCAVYSVWIFLPASLKRRIATALMASSSRLRSSRRLQTLAQKQGGCGSGCDSCGPAKPVQEHKIQLFRRR
ncbi:DUF6587 family protein [Polaromonas sp. UC242_47]|uniref:DUF6587 family protein n=1 Tax=Polaromonas sp. UC242_47 TaxID=3374626 RepID=UPI003796A285